MNFGPLTQKIGPLPLIAWVAIGAGAYFFIVRPRIASGSSGTPAASYVQVPTGNGSGGGGSVGGSGVDFGPLEQILNQGFSGLSAQLSALSQPSQAPPPASNPTPTITGPAQSPASSFANIIPQGFQFFGNTGYAGAPQYTYQGATPLAGQVPATINADLVQRWTKGGYTPQQIASMAGLVPGAHSSIAPTH